jgi:hypothetical protein
MNSPPPKPEVILTNFFAEPTVLLVPITSRALSNNFQNVIQKSKKKTGNIKTHSKHNHDARIIYVCADFNSQMAIITFIR